jgi:hypothetical protein
VRVRPGLRPAARGRRAAGRLETALDDEAEAALRLTAMAHAVIPHEAKTADWAAAEKKARAEKKPAHGKQ